jgi:methylisocitrate lyase
LANITEFGATPLYNKMELADNGVDMVLYPLSALRAANKAALNVYQHLLDDGDQKAVVDTMQTRMELYDFLNYHAFEEKLDSLFSEGKNL